MDHYPYFCLVMCSAETAVGPDNAGASLNVSNDSAFFFFFFTKRKSEIVGFFWIFHQWQIDYHYVFFHGIFILAFWRGE